MEEQHAVILLAFITVWQCKYMLNRDFEASCSVCLHLKGCVCSPVLCGSNVVSSLAYGVEMSANFVSASPSAAEGTTPSSASSALSSFAGSSRKTHAI